MNNRSAGLTAELRLWWPDAVPDAVCDGFFEGRRNLPLESRADTYFDPAHGHLGIKRRSDTGALEIKMLVSDDLALADGLVGQFWAKGITGVTLDAGSGVDVSKRRFLRSFTVDRKEMLEHEPTARRSDAPACTVELTEVLIGEAPTTWWSVGFEVSGGLEDGPRILKAIIDSTRLTRLPLSNAMCESYPEWMLRI